MAYRQLANVTLLGVAVLYTFVIVWRQLAGAGFGLNLLLATLQAALIGGIADWFAVTALFRRPLGFVWHTALIPRNRVRLTQAMATMVEQDLLSVTALESSLRKVRLVSAGMAWLTAHGGREWLKSLIIRYLRDICAQSDIPAIAAVSTRWLQQLLQSAPITSLFAEGLKKTLPTGKVEKLWVLLLDELVDLARRESTHQAILAYLSSLKAAQTMHRWQKAVINLAEQTDSLNLPAVAASLQQQLVTELVACKRQEHPLYQWFFSQLQTAADRLESDPTWAASVTGWYQALVSRLALAPMVAALLELVQQAAMTPMSERNSISPLEDWANSQIDKYWQQFMTNEQLQEMVEIYLRRALQVILAQSHELVGKIVQDALGGLTDGGLNAFVEARAGEDLAWIRVNGSVVGGVVGFVLYLFVYFVFDPFISPAARAALSF